MTKSYQVDNDRMLFYSRTSSIVYVLLVADCLNVSSAAPLPSSSTRTSAIVDVLSECTATYKYLYVMNICANIFMNIIIPLWDYILFKYAKICRWIIFYDVVRAVLAVLAVHFFHNIKCCASAMQILLLLAAFHLKRGVFPCYFFLWRFCCRVRLTDLWWRLFYI